MTLILLANTVADAAAQIIQTDSSDVETSTGHHECVEQGTRLTYWNAGVTAARRIAYVNKTNKLSADYMVLLDAVNHVGYSLKTLSWSDYPSTLTTHETKTLAAGDLVGPNARDYVYAFSSLQTNKEAFGIELASSGYNKTVTSLYFGAGFEMEYFAAERGLEFVPVAEGSAPIQYGRDLYFLSGQLSFDVGNLTQDNIDSFNALPDDEPMLLYDSSGDILEHKLLHCILLDSEVYAAFNDLYAIRFTFGVIRDSWML